MQYLTTGGDILEKSPDFKLVGRDEDLKKLSAILMRSKAASVILVGPGGVGSTALCMGLQASKNQPDVPFDIVQKRMFWLQTDELLGAEDIGASFNRILGILKRTPDSVLLIEDARNFIAGSQAAGFPLLINALNALIREGKTQVILEVRDDDLDFVLKCHGDMRESYTLIDLEEPIGDDLVTIAVASAKSLEKHHGITIDHAAILKSIELTNKYRTRDASLSRAQPERTGNLLDRALSTFRLDAHKQTNPEDQALLKRFYNDARDAEIAVVELEEQLEVKLKEESDRRGAADKTDAVDAAPDIFKMIGNIGADSPEVASLRAQLKQFQQAIEENRKKYNEITSRINANLKLTEKDVTAEFSRLSGIAADKLNEDEREKLKTLEEELNKQIFGQKQVMTALANAIKIARIGRRNKGKPQASFLFLGPSGTGKTEACKALARLLLDDEAALTRFDMSEYMEKHAVAKLIGAPPGYEGFDVGGILTNAMRKNPRRIILFDEIEKAHPDVFNIFLQILSDGRLTDNVGRTVSFSEAIIIMTSNICQPQLLEGDHEGALEALLATPGIRPEFLNRFAGRQNIMFFDVLDLGSIQKIVSREIKSLDDAYRENGITTQLAEGVLEQFCKAHYDPAIGGRGLPGIIQTQLEPIIANTILDNPDFTGTLKVSYDTKEDKFVTVIEPNLVELPKKSEASAVAQA